MTNNQPQPSAYPLPTLPSLRLGMLTMFITWTSTFSGQLSLVVEVETEHSFVLLDHSGLPQYPTLTVHCNCLLNCWPLPSSFCAPWKQGLCCCLAQLLLSIFNANGKDCTFSWVGCFYFATEAWYHFATWFSLNATLFEITTFPSTICSEKRETAFNIKLAET